MSSRTEESTQILDLGANCWRRERASRAAFLIDGDAYFRAFRKAVARAQRSVTILAWDIHSRVRLQRDDPADDLPVELAPFLHEVARRRRGLKIRVLTWDYAFIYASEREWLPAFRFRTWGGGVDFQLDSRHPLGASHHQKVVVVDDRVAFAGGIDLSVWRWDSSAHEARDERRTDPDGRYYQPFHDVQMVVEGPIARSLAELARERWHRATGERIRAVGEVESSPWPERLEPDLRDTEIAIARTMPRLRGQDEVREVERLYLDSIARARRFIYLENQYLSSGAVGEALARRLREPDGPEVVIVLPRATGGWLEQKTMDVLRAGVLQRLREADRHERLRVFHPVTGKGEHESVYVHSKLEIVDDRFLRIGSANLSNRSMGLDTECDLAVEADTDAKRGAIRDLRLRLLAEHLDLDVRTVRERLGSPESLGEAIVALRGGEGRTLRDLDVRLDSDVDRYLAETEWLDPERPADPDQFIDATIPPGAQPPARRRLILTAYLGALALGGFLLIKWGESFGLHGTAWWQQSLAGLGAHPLGPIAVVLAVMMGGLIGVPMNLLLVGAVLAFGPWRAFGCGLLGGYLSALAGFGIGHLCGRRAVIRLAGDRLLRVSREVARRGVLAVALVRLVPVAPFLFVNLAAGASHLRFRDFSIGTAVGLTPGMLIVAVLTERVDAVVREPALANLLWLALTVGVALGVITMLRRWLRARTPDGDQANRTTVKEGTSS